jgi:hypothetical protein
MGFVAGVIDSCGSIRNNRVRVNCPPTVLAKVGGLLDVHTIPYKVQPPYLTVGQEEGLILLYSCVPLVCSVKRAALKKVVSRICIGGMEPYPVVDMDDIGWLHGVMVMRGAHITTGKNQWYSITHTDTDLVRHLGHVLLTLDIDYKLYTVERDGRRTLYNTRIYRLPNIRKLLSMSATA